MEKKVVALNENGKPIGQGHHKAGLTDEQVDRIRDLREDHELTYDQLAKMFGVHRSSIASICQYRTRAQTPFGFKELSIEK